MLDIIGYCILQIILIALYLVRKNSWLHSMFFGTGFYLSFVFPLKCWCISDMDDRHVAEYFAVAGLPANPQPLAEFSSQGANIKPSHSRAPITDIGVFNRTVGETLPDG